MSVMESELVKLTPIRVGWMSRENAAEYADVSVSRIDRAISQQELRVARRGSLVRIKPEWVDAWLDTPQSEQDYEDDA